jgi:hypothetical protein
VHSEAGEIPALSRNGDAGPSNSAADEPGRLACANDLSSEEGRLGPMPGWRRSERTSSSKYAEDDHAGLHP